MIHIIGGGLAGCEAAWQAASMGVPVTLYEMRPGHATPVHKTDRLGELVCSNSLRGNRLDHAVGLLKEEMRRLGSLVMRVADATSVPAGVALAVDRGRFAEGMTAAIEAQPFVTVVREEVRSIPPSGRGPVVIATGPLTSDSLSREIAAFVGSEHLSFYDAVSPIIVAETIDHTRVFRASRWRRQRPAPRAQADRAAGQVSMDTLEPDRAIAADDDEGDYLNCPLGEAEYARFYDALIHAEPASVHDFEGETFFEGCLPVEVMANRGFDTLRFGPMKPVGLIDPQSGRQPYAVVQLRQDTLAADHYSMVGFQTQLKWGEQKRVFRLIPGLENAEFARYGVVHRNTYINAPRVLLETWQTRPRADLFVAGQISGVEGYVESAASGLMAGRNAAALALGRPLQTPPPTTAIGALAHYVSHADPRRYQPTNITFGIIRPLDAAIRDRATRKLATAQRALQDLAEWEQSAAAALAQ